MSEDNTVYGMFFDPNQECKFSSLGDKNISLEQFMVSQYGSCFTNTDVQLFAVCIHILTAPLHLKFKKLPSTTSMPIPQREQVWYPEQRLSISQYFTTTTQSV